MIVLAFHSLALFFLVFVFYSQTKLEIYDESEINTFKKNTPKENLHIGIIGDSWVADGRIGFFLEKKLKEAGVNTVVISSGQSGANSKSIYRNLLRDANEIHSSKIILSEGNISYCIVIAGVNDAATHMGQDFYAHHMLRIITTLLKNEITPLIVELPEFGIRELKSRGTLSDVKRFLFRHINDGGKTNIINDYRQSLKKALNNEDMQGYVIMDFDEIVSSYNESLYLYQNPGHLNDKGYVELASAMANKIVDLENKLNH